MKRNIFSEIGFNKEEETLLEIKSELLDQILLIIEQYALTQTQLQEIWETSQPRVSEVLNGKISSISMEKLCFYLLRLGCLPQWSFTFKKALVG